MADDTTGQGPMLAEILREVRRVNNRLDQTAQESAEIRRKQDQMETDIAALQRQARQGKELDDAWRDAKRWSRLMLRALLTAAAIVTSLVVLLKQGGELAQHAVGLLTRR